MSFSLIAFIKAIILPPTINFSFIVFGLCFKQRRLLSQFFIYTGVLSLVLFCLPICAHFLLKNLEDYPALKPPVVTNNEQAIVVLSGGSYANAKEYAKDTDGFITLQRNHYAAFLQKQTGLPVLVTGGNIELEVNTEASVMADTLEKSFNIEVAWQEHRSRNTAENAIYSAAILKENNIDTIFLVTHAWHMPRSVYMFEKQSINVTPAPTIFTNERDNLSWRDVIPSASALFQTRMALHEYIGMLWYKFNY